MFIKSSLDFPVSYLQHQLQKEEMRYVGNKMKASSPKITAKNKKTGGQNTAGVRKWV